MLNGGVNFNQFLAIFAVVSRTKTRHSSKLFIEVRQVIEAAFITDISNAQVVFGQ